MSPQRSCSATDCEGQSWARGQEAKQDAREAAWSGCGSSTLRCHDGRP